MKILITGITGFIGKNLSDSLVKRTDYEIYGIVRKSSNIDDLNKKIKIFRYSGDIRELIQFFKNNYFKGVIHIASLFIKEHSYNDIESLINSNILFGTQLLEACKITNVQWFINTGTFWQNYNNEEYNPVNLYAATKEAFEKIAKYYVETSKMVFVTLKLNDTFGVGDKRKKILNLWIENITNDKEINMTKGDQIIDISYIKDVVNAYVRLIELLNNKERNTLNMKTYVVSNRDKVKLKDLAKLFEEISGKKLKINWGKIPYREREVIVPYNKGELIPGWTQKYSLKDALEEFIKITLKRKKDEN